MLSKPAPAEGLTREKRELMRLAQQTLGVRSDSVTTDDAVKAVFETLRLAIIAHADDRCPAMLAGLRQHATDCRAAVEAAGNLERWEMALDPNMPDYARLGKRECERREAEHGGKAEG